MAKRWTPTADIMENRGDWCQMQGGWELELVEREPGSHGFQVQPRHWIVERCFALVTAQSPAGEGLRTQGPVERDALAVATIRLLTARLGRRERFPTPRL